MRFAVSLLLLALALVASPMRAMADVATPVATPTAGDCTVAPRTPAAIAEIVGEVAAAAATPFPSPAPYTPPAGTPADANSVAGVTETARQLVACVNGGDFLRFLALFSNDALRRYAVDLELPLKSDDDRLTPEPSTGEQLVLAAVEDVLVLPDGRVNALVRIADATDPAGGFELQLALVRVDDRWLIDELTPIAPPKATWSPVSGPGYDGVIVDAAGAPDFALALRGEEVLGGWDPTPDDVAQLEANLPGFLKTAPGAAPDLWQRVATYKRQYAGIVTADGRSLILVNAFCDPTGTDWHTEPVFVLDGGDCYFSVIFDPSTGTFSDLRINGEG
jgi:hypothetical protein